MTTKNVEKPPISKRLRRAAGLWARDVLLALATLILAEVLDWIALRKLPTGHAYVLKVQGLADLQQSWHTALIFVGFIILNTIPAFAVRRGLAIVLRLFIFLLLGVFLFVLVQSKAIAVVQTDDGFTFVRALPFKSIFVSTSAIPKIHLENTTDVRSLSLGEIPDQIDCLPVSHDDVPANQAIDRLISALNQAKSGK